MYFPPSLASRSSAGTLMRKDARVMGMPLVNDLQFTSVSLNVEMWLNWSSIYQVPAGSIITIGNSIVEAVG